MSTKKRKVFNIEEKTHIIWRLENGKTNRDIAKEFGVSHSTISTIWKNKDKILALFEKNSLKVKRSRASNHRLIEEALLAWFNKQRTNEATISGPMLQQKANDFARMMGQENFECSSSWVQRFRVRHNITSGKVDAEGGPEEWLSHKWPALCAGYKPEEIFNATETGIFFHFTPDKTRKFIGEQCIDGQLSNARVTVLVVANMPGTSKEKLLVVGNAEKPHCSLPVIYESNTKSWMTLSIFEQWLRNWDVQLQSKGDKVLLLINNPAHHLVSKLTSIKLVFVPPYVTSVWIQPMDRGVIRALKTQYRTLQILQMLQHCQHRAERKRLSVFDAILMLSEAWEKVTPTTIVNCFRRAGFKDLSVSSVKEEMSLTNTNEDDKLTQLMGQLPKELRCDTIDEFIRIDESVAVCGTVKTESNYCDNTDEVIDLQEQFRPVTLCEAINAVTTLQKFVAMNEEFDLDNNLDILSKMKRKMQNTFDAKLKNND